MTGYTLTETLLAAIDKAAKTKPMSVDVLITLHDELNKSRGDAETPLTRTELANAFDAFWNGALGAQRREDNTVGAIVEGFAAVANELRK